MVKQILAIILFIIGCIVVLFFRNYNGHLIPHPFLIFLSGLAMIGCSFWLGKSSMNDQLRAVKDATNEEVDELKANGEKVKVDLSLCEVTDHVYYEEGEKYDEFTPSGVKDGTRAWNALTDSQQNIARTEIHQSVIICTVNRNGKEEEYRSNALSRDRETLMFKLFAQKETYLYIDRRDPGHYYLDLEFLNG